MLPRILPHRLLVKKIHRNIVVSGSETAAGCCEVGARIPGILQFIQAVFNLLSHLGMGKQQILQPGLQLLQLPWDLFSFSGPRPDATSTSYFFRTQTSSKREAVRH